MPARWHRRSKRSISATWTRWAAAPARMSSVAMAGTLRCADCSRFTVPCSAGNTGERAAMLHRETKDAVAFVVHDAAPATWPECAALLRMLDELGAKPVTLLVVPHYHYRDPIVKDRGFVAALDARLARGDELALHGFHHRDDEPPPRTLRGFVERRLLTRAEGEFAALNEAAAAWRISHGIDAFRALRWPLHGFVPPAWLLGAASRSAIERCGFSFRYVSARRGL